MRRQLSYEDAVRILGGGERKLMKYLDRASAVSLVAVGGFNFFDARETFVRLGGELITKLSERLRGIDRLTRTERLMAAHTVIVTTAFLDALSDSVATLAPVSSSQITAVQELSLVGGHPLNATRRTLVEWLVEHQPDTTDTAHVARADAGSPRRVLPNTWPKRRHVHQVVRA